jgi:hypothetical protein
MNHTTDSHSHGCIGFSRVIEWHAQIQMFSEVDEFDVKKRRVSGQKLIGEDRITPTKSVLSSITERYEGPILEVLR